MSKKSKILFLFSALLLLAACGGPTQEYHANELLLEESFNSASAWESYAGGDVDIRVDDGEYRMQTDAGGYVWGLNEQEHDNVVIEVTSNQLSSFENNAYGVMCRADESNNGDGYYFLISGDGYYLIAKGEGDNVNPLVEWTASSAINEGQTENKIVAVCIDNYFALYVNDEFLTEVNDSEYTSGYAGFAAAAFDGGAADVVFDDLTISVGSFFGD